MIVEVEEIQRFGHKNGIKCQNETPDAKRNFGWIDHDHGIVPTTTPSRRPKTRSTGDMNKSINYAVLVGAGLTAGAITAILFMKQKMNASDKKSKCDHCLRDEQDKRARLPELIILVRHGESEGNADNTLWRKKADNLIELSGMGVDEADFAGERMEKIFQMYDDDENLPSMKRIHLIVSPFERTIQTSFFMRPHIDHRIVRTDVETRIREQEFGNLQDDEFQSFREEQKTIGRFWYRFPTGESGADVYDRVKSWWFESVLTVNNRVGYEPVDALVVVTHGLTMRFVLMQLFHWSPTTFHSVWNADNCDLYVLRKDLQKPGLSPYILDDKLGETPQSSVDALVKFDNGNTKVFKLTDYLSIPPPRTTRFELIKKKLIDQYPTLEEENIVDIIITQGSSGPMRTSIDRLRASERSSIQDKYNGFERAERERSCRFPNYNPNL